MKNKVNEWQELSLKKDIEKIVKVISRKQVIDYSIIIDLGIAVAALLLDNLLSQTAPERIWLFWCLFVPCALLLAWHLWQFIGELLKKHNSKYSVYPIQELIDSFDNDICYYVMMADAYNQMLTDAITQDNNLVTFYYIETWYYINKAKAKMYSMQFKTKQIFTKEPDDVVKKNKILISRLVNITQIMEDIRISTNALISNKAIRIQDYSPIETSKKYDWNYKDFISEINQNFGNQITIDFNEKDRFLPNTVITT